jgi:hypothetical protein
MRGGKERDEVETKDAITCLRGINSCRTVHCACRSERCPEEENNKLCNLRFDIAGQPSIPPRRSSFRSLSLAAFPKEFKLGSASLRDAKLSHPALSYRRLNHWLFRRHSWLFALHDTAYKESMMPTCKRNLFFSILSANLPCLCVCRAYDFISYQQGVETLGSCASSSASFHPWLHSLPLL